VTLAPHSAPIVAIATAPGRGSVGIVRLSGPDLSAVIRTICGRPLAPRHATLVPFVDAGGEPLDEGLAIHFPAPHSYTGEDVLELQAHGGSVLLQLLLARCLEAGRAIGLRLAEPGEFTRRAFLNDKLDLTQAEAVADLIDASTEAAARSAGRALAGEFSQRVEALAAHTVRLRTLVEATLDFPEEEIDVLQQADARGQLVVLANDLAALLAQARQGALLREGLRVVIAGQPNVGKSSLLNALAGAELAIVTPIPGTTRDRVSESIQIEGVPVHVTDTAGLRRDEQAADEVERIGIGRSWEAIRSADSVLFLHDLTRAGRDAAYDAAEREIAATLPPGLVVIDVWNKADVATLPPEEAARLPAARGETSSGGTRGALWGSAEPSGERPAVGSTSASDTENVIVSARTGQGLEELRHALLRVAGWRSTHEGVFIARARHVQALRRCAGHLDAALVHLDDPAPALDLLAEELRLAHQGLGEITGVFSTEDLLGEIFGRFCIGK
jgi:tRNA modification GTPase